MATSSFATRLREVREAAGYTHELLGAKLGRSAQSVALWERGKAQPPRSVQVRLAAVLDAPDLLDIDGAELTRRSRVAQGLPEHVEDPAVLALVAALIAPLGDTR